MAKTEAKTTTGKKAFPILPAIGIGCLVILVLTGIGFAVAGKFIASKFGQKMVTEGIKKGIEQQTGVKVDTDNGGVMTFKDNKTGSEVVVGGGTIPSDFPKDFPIYPGSKPTGTVSGSDKGFWLVLESSDAVATVGTWYGEQLKAKGWTIDDTMTFGDSSTYQVTKNKLTGTVVISGNKDDKKGTTGILITLNPETSSSENTSTNE
jgi:hypothetical protein